MVTALPGRCCGDDGCSSTGGVVVRGWQVVATTIVPCAALDMHGSSSSFGVDERGEQRLVDHGNLRGIGVTAQPAVDAAMTAAPSRAASWCAARISGRRQWLRGGALDMHESTNAASSGS